MLLNRVQLIEEALSVQEHSHALLINQIQFDNDHVHLSYSRHSAGQLHRQDEMQDYNCDEASVTGVLIAQNEGKLLFQ